MIVTCPECTSRFRIPDDKVVDGGVRVRCSKCKTVFRALDDPSAPRPTGPPVPAPTPMPSLPAMPGALRPPGGAAGPPSGPGFGTAGTGLFSSAEGFLVDLPGSPPGGGPPDPLPAPGPLEGTASAVHSLGGTPFGGRDSGPPGFGDDLELDPFHGRQPAPGPAQAEPLAPGLGGPRRPEIALDDGRSPTGPTPTSPPPAATPRDRPVRTSAQADLPTRSSLGALLFVTLLVLDAACVFVLWRNDWRADLRRAGDMVRIAAGAREGVVPPAPLPAAPRIELLDVAARVLEGDQGRQILIVDGLARNTGDVPVRAVAIAGRLIDGESGTEVRKATAPALGQVEADVLRGVRAPDDVLRAHRGLGDDRPQPPGADAGFTVIFPDLPEDFAAAKQRYRYEVRVGGFDEVRPAEPAEAGGRQAPPG